MNFEACLSLPHDAREAALIADNLEALARALREWPVDAWLAINPQKPKSEGLFERLVARTASVAIDPYQQRVALHSAEAVAAVLRVMWPEPTAPATPAVLAAASA